MSGIIGERDDEQNQAQPANQTVPVSTSEVSESPVVNSQEISSSSSQAKHSVAPAATQPRKPGRPRKSDTEKIEEIRATFIANAEQMRQVKYISLVEGKLLKDVLADAIRFYVSAWESENGKIKLPKSK